MEEAVIIDSYEEDGLKAELLRIKRKNGYFFNVNIFDGKTNKFKKLFDKDKKAVPGRPINQEDISQVLWYSCLVNGGKIETVRRFEDKVLVKVRSELLVGNFSQSL